MSVGKWDSASAKTHFDVWGDFNFIFLQNYTVKLLEIEHTNSQLQ